MCGFWVYSPKDHLYFFNLQKGQFQPKINFNGNGDLLSIQPIVEQVKTFEKNIKFLSSLKLLRHRLANRKEFILAPEKYFKNLKDKVIDTVSL